jgi:lipoprotein-anchoring transpeptidase ErfK/SrfK
MPRLGRLGLLTLLSISACSAGEAAFSGAIPLFESEVIPNARPSRAAVALALPAVPPVPLAKLARVDPVAPKTGADVMPVAPSAPLGPEPELVAIAREAFVYAGPSRRSRKLGYLRLGARVRRSAEPASSDGCPGGFYRVAPEGYVCVGETASLDVAHPLAALVDHVGDREEGLPFVYGRAAAVPPPRYSRLPTYAEVKAVEGSTRRAVPKGFDALRDAELPELLRSGGALPTTFGFSRAGTALAARALPNSGFAFVKAFEHEGRRYGLTTELELVPLDRLAPVEPSAFHGVVLDAKTPLPVVFVRSKRAKLHEKSPTGGFLVKRALDHREALSLTGESIKAGGMRYLATRAGDYVRDQDVLRIDARKKLPVWAKGERTWIHVSLRDQTLVAYVGDRPVYATLVSTGLGRSVDGKESLETPVGRFLIHTKHVSASMSGDELGDAFDLGEVPYVQYFSEGYALHAAYWHDSFGTPRSHGCINLSPSDARYLFHYSDPPVPRGFHGAFSLREGTLLEITE